jgi:hypothetical protein
MAKGRFALVQVRWSKTKGGDQPHVVRTLGRYDTIEDARAAKTAARGKPEILEYVGRPAGWVWTSENPYIEEPEDYLRIGVAVVLVGAIGYLIWDRSQANATSQAATSPAVSYAATDINPPPPPVPVPPPPGGWPGTSPLPVPPS